MDRGFLRKIVPLSLIVSAVIAVGGCGSEPNQMDGKFYSQDGYLGLSNSNPNFRMNPTHHNYSKDRQLMRQTLREMGLDKQSTIFMNGTNVTVTIYLSGLEPQEAEVIRTNAYSMLKGNVPRYDYNIRIE